MSRYVPPHRKREVSEIAGDGATTENSGGKTTSEELQRESWQALSRSITGIINRVSGDNVQLSVTELFRENIIRGRGLLCRSLMRAQLADPDLSNVFSSLVSRVNKEFSIIGLLLVKRLVVQWWRLHRRRDWTALRCVSRFLAWLYIFNVVSVEVIYQIILAHLTSEKRCDDDVDQAAALFRETFRAMSQRDVGEFHAHVLTPIRDLLAMDDDALRLSARAQTLLEACLREVQAWERVKHTVSIIPPHLLLVEPSEQKCHEVDLDEAATMNAEEQLDRFSVDAEYDAHEDAYEAARCAVLGDDWETELLEQVAAAEDEAAAADEVEEGPGVQGRMGQEQHPAGDAVKHIVDERERQLRKDVYMAIRSSVRADEVVHKILKSMPPQAERTVCFMVVEGCCEESIYKRIYGMVAERLCKSNAKFQGFFAEAFRARYEHAEDLVEKQIEYTCKIYSHLLRTNSLPWQRCLSVLDIIESDMSQRLVIQWLLQGMVEALGMRAVQERFEKDKELRSSTAKLFPLNAPEEGLERAVNLFEAMGLGELGAGVRAQLEKLRRSRMAMYASATSTYNSRGPGGDADYYRSHKRSRENMREYI
ncbi:pre-mRNA-splicing factor CWC22 [Trypanosoma conorhini]|uniref:Pre-mRNA-splicing factor CWC22 n=1 Tax=Trypanosoma conorhini TaxID=83891 RepID=A0A3R7LPW9_9TRYP|nr:pre-mRNA-splicing factor CWC22 [Trypanosoma conorhini]RNF18494.1 pre-mRNA-splicing factor CWC22 [Trypanosoma conorhini]